MGVEDSLAGCVGNSRIGLGGPTLVQGASGRVTERCLSAPVQARQARLSHVSARRDGVNFILETDADRALELVSPPFFVQTVPGTMIPRADHVRKMDRLMQERLSALVADNPTLGTLATSFGADPGLTFKLAATKVEPANIGHETKGDFYKDSPALAVDTLSAIKVHPSIKGSGSVTEHVISAQANFATDLTTLEQVQAQSRNELGDYSKPFAALEAQVVALLTASYARTETSAANIEDQATRVPRFLLQLAGPLSGELPSRR